MSEEQAGPMQAFNMEHLDSEQFSSHTFLVF